MIFGGDGAMPMFRRRMRLVLIGALIVMGSVLYALAGEKEEASVKNVAPSPDVVVHVAGAVKNPGVVSLPMESRVEAAIRACGGEAPGADLDKLNLAEPIHDGMKIMVPEKIAQSPHGNAPDSLASPRPSTGSAMQNMKTMPEEKNARGETIVHLNSADASMLDTLPGIGPVMAQRIIDYRMEHGGFKTIDELKNVRGIGDVRFSRLRDRLAL